MLDDLCFDDIFIKLEEGNKFVVGYLGELLNCWFLLEEMIINNDCFYFKNNL